MSNNPGEYYERTFKSEDFSGQEIVAKHFSECVFKSCRFQEATLNRCRFTNCRFDKCDLSLVKVPKTSFANTTFENCKVIGVDWTQSIWFAGNLFCPVNFQGSVISHSTFIGLDLHGILIKDCVAKNVDFREADLTKAVLVDSDLEGCLFMQTDLTQADFTHARNYSINPAANKLEKAKFSLPDAMGLLSGLGIILVD